MRIYKEEEFFKDKGWPPEEYYYCDFVLPVDYENVKVVDYDQFILVSNAMYPYMRLSKKRGHSQWPCGMSTSPSTTGCFASKSDDERDEICPKIVWGVAAWYISCLSFSGQQQDYVLNKEQILIFKEYYNRCWNIYKESHNSLKYSKISIEQKELNFLSEHGEIERRLWDRSTPLRAYPTLYNYAKDAREEYDLFLRQKIKQLETSMMPNNFYSTEICSAPSGPYIRVFFLDDSNALKAKEIVAAVNSVKKVNSGESQSSSHPGHYLIVYLKPMVTAEYCVKEIHEALNLYFSNTSVGKMHASNEAKFAEIESRILDYLNMASASIDVCVAWFTITELRDKLLEKASEGVKVRVIIYNDGVNHSKGVDLTGLNHKEYRGERGGIMHNKFCVIDNVHTICGSYNWTRNAEDKNDEDAAFHFEDYKFASEFTKRFNQMWSRDGNED